VAGVCSTGFRKYKVEQECLRTSRAGKWRTGTRIQKNEETADPRGVGKETAGEDHNIAD
jgi:hypothetical protein